MAENFPGTDTPARTPEVPDKPALEGLEKKLDAAWQAEKLYHFDESATREQVYSIDTGQVSALTGVPLAGSYLQLVDDQPGGLAALSLPRLDAGPFLSYGIQWIAFGIIAPIGLGYFIRAEIQQRRREKDARRSGRNRPRGKKFEIFKNEDLTGPRKSGILACVTGA